MGQSAGSGRGYMAGRDCMNGEEPQQAVQSVQMRLTPAKAKKITVSR